VHHIDVISAAGICAIARRAKPVVAAKIWDAIEAKHGGK
jgi:hypothetical protein